MAVSAAERGLVSAGPSGLCAPGESWAVPSVAPALRRRNTRLAYRGERGEWPPEASRGGLAPPIAGGSHCSSQCGRPRRVDCD